MELVMGLMLRCIKTEVVERLNTASELMRVDLEINLVPIKKVVVGEIMSFRISCRKFLVAAIKKVLERSPLKYKSTNAISCLNPNTILYNRSTSELRIGDLLFLHLHQSNWL